MEVLVGILIALVVLSHWRGLLGVLGVLALFGWLVAHPHPHVPSMALVLIGLCVVLLLGSHRHVR